MGVVAKRLIFVGLLISIVEGRILSLYSLDDGLISDGIIEKQESSLSSCNHQYGFLPCAENAAGYIFLIVVYQVLLVVGGRLISSGSEVLFHIIGAGKFGGIIFRILMALPSMMLMILSGIFGSKEDAEAQVSVGVGVYAGITVFSLTIQWGMVMIYGKIDLKAIADEITELTSDSSTSPSKGKTRIFRDTGVKIDKKTSYTAGIMLLSLIPYVVLQLVYVFNTYSGKRIITLIALIVSSLSLLSYFTYQIWDPWMQERSLNYSKFDIVRKGFLQHVKRLGQLVNQDGKLNIDLIKGLFDETDKNDDNFIATKEMRKLVSNIFRAGKTDIDKNDAVDKVMDLFDKNDDGKITEEEFIKGFKQWAYEAERSYPDNDFFPKNMSQQLLNLFKDKKANKGEMMDKVMAKVLKHSQGQLLKSELLITENGEPNMERIHQLFREFDTDGNKSISAPELKQIITRLNFSSYQLNEDDVLKEIFKEFDRNNNDFIDEPEFVEGVTKYVDKAIQAAHTSGVDGTKIIEEFERSMWKGAEYGKRAFVKSAFQVLLGIAILTFLGKPLTSNILELSHAMGFPSFIISFVVVPLTMNARSAIAAVLPASKKSEESASLTFSEVARSLSLSQIYYGLSSYSLTDLRWSDNEQHGGIDDVVGNCVCKRINMGFLSRSAHHFGRVRYNRHSCILPHNLPSMDVHTRIPPLSSFPGFFLFCSGFI
ncbi:hypothetical protein C2S53_014827 [Perilla frutescens var. hirtella]|uniref:EF-hand domain-containing protein n=1 Tax=Perilla frutescens var. hirtella TaxID=608512 RepID=A0AAD4P6W4_PERFH|nr:hypothetical protein C2S53_014827 [Perilla frutescens var. hirtella]